MSAMVVNTIVMSTVVMNTIGLMSQGSEVLPVDEVIVAALYNWLALCYFARVHSFSPSFQLKLTH